MPGFRRGPLRPQEFLVPAGAFRTSPVVVTPGTAALVLTAFAPDPIVTVTISGITRDEAGAILGSCIVTLFRTDTNIAEQSQTSNPATGVYSFRISRAATYGKDLFDSRPYGTSALAAKYYVIAYKAGAPDVAGTTVNTLVGV